MLAHRAYVIVSVGIVIKSLHGEWIRLIVHPLFAVEPVVFHIGFDSGFLHEAVVLLRAVSRVRDSDLGQSAVTVVERFVERYHRQWIAGSLEEPEVKYKLVLRSDL